MFKPFLSRLILWPLVRRGLVSLVLVLGSAYASLGNELFLRAGLVINRAAESLSAAATTLRLRSLSSEVHESCLAFEELRGHRDVLDEQACALEARQLELSLALRQEEVALQIVLGLLSDKGTAGEPPFSRAEIERDAAELLRRVQIHCTGLREYETTLSQLAQARDVLDRKLAAADGSLRQHYGDLERQQANFTGQQAYSKALDAARRLEIGTRTWDRQPTLALNP